MKRLGLGMIFVLSLCSPTQGGTDRPRSNLSDRQAERDEEVIIQIGGRFCEYHRKDVDTELRRHSGVHSVEFLNDHGTVLVRYQSDTVVPIQLAESVERALTMGIGCKAWVDRGGRQSTS